MKDASDIIREWIYGVLYKTILYGGSYVDVYSFAPKDASFPYILIGEQAMTGETESAKDRFITGHEVTIEIWTSSTGNDSSYIPANTIADSALQLLRQRATETHGSGGTTLPGFTGFNCITIIVSNLITERFLMENSIIIYKSINLKLLLEEN
jgi:hypothetical protein